MNARAVSAFRESTPFFSSDKILYAASPSLSFRCFLQDWLTPRNRIDWIEWLESSQTGTDIQVLLNSSIPLPISGSAFLGCTKCTKIGIGNCICAILMWPPKFPLAIASNPKPRSCIIIVKSMKSLKDTCSRRKYKLHRQKSDADAPARKKTCVLLVRGDGGFKLHWAQQKSIASRIWKACSQEGANWEESVGALNSAWRGESTCVRLFCWSAELVEHSAAEFSLSAWLKMQWKIMKMQQKGNSQANEHDKTNASCRQTQL